MDRLTSSNNLHTTRSQLAPYTVPKQATSRSIKTVGGRSARNNITLIGTSHQKQKGRSDADKMKLKIMHRLTHKLRQDFPRLQETSYLSPPVHFNRVSHRPHEVCGMTVKVVSPNPQLSDARSDESLQRLHSVLSALATALSDVMFVVFGLDFDNYLNNAQGLLVTDGVEKQGSSQSQDGVTLKEGQQSTGSAQRVCTHCRHSHVTTETPTTATDTKHAEPTPDLSVFARPRDLDSSLQRGSFDILVINRQHGVMIYDVKAVGDAFSMSDDLQTIHSQHALIRRKVARSLKQLDKAETVLRYLLHDLTGQRDLLVRKGLMLPNLEKQTVHTAILQDPQLAKDFEQCMGACSLHSALQRCLFRDDVPAIGCSTDINDDIITRIRSHWWDPLVGGTSQLQPCMDCELYENIIARLGGAATAQHVSTAHSPRAQVNTLSQGVRHTSLCFADPVLTKLQVDILNTKSSRVYLTGPPGTAKTLMLQLKAQDSMLCGKDVLVVSLWEGSEAVSRHIHHKIMENARSSDQSPRLITSKTPRLADILDDITRWVKTRAEPAQQSGVRPHHLGIRLNSDYERSKGEADRTRESELRPPRAASLPNPVVECGVNSRNGHMAGDRGVVPGAVGEYGRSKSGREQTVCIVIDEAPWFLGTFVNEVDKLFGKEHVEIWAFSSFPGWRPNTFQEVVLNQSLRCPPVVIKEMQRGSAYNAFNRHLYTSLDAGVLAGTPPPTDGPPVKRIQHSKHQDEDADCLDVWDCLRCGEEVAAFLTEDLAIAPCDKADEASQGEQLHFSDVLISGYVPALPDVTTHTGKTRTDVTTSTGKNRTDVTTSTGKNRTDVTTSTGKNRTDVTTSTGKNRTDVTTSTGKNRTDVTTSTGKNRTDVTTSTGKNRTDVTTSTGKNRTDVTTSTGKNRTDDDKLSEEPMDTDTVVSPPDRAQSGHTHAFLEGLERGHVLFEIIPRGTAPPSRGSLAKPELKNRVQVAEPVGVVGLERPVVVVIGTSDVRKTYPRYVDPWFDVVSRCTSQLIVVGDVEHGMGTPLGNMAMTD